MDKQRPFAIHIERFQINVSAQITFINKIKKISFINLFTIASKSNLAYSPGCSERFIFVAFVSLIILFKSNDVHNFLHSPPAFCNVTLLQPSLFPEKSESLKFPLNAFCSKQILSARLCTPQCTTN